MRTTLNTHSYYVTATRGLVGLVDDELRQLGARVTRVEPAGVRVRGPLHFGYRVCLWSRCASRVILHLHDFKVEKTDDLYDAALAFPWEDHVAPAGTIAVDVTAQGEVVTHSRFAAQRIKDGVVDRMRDRFGTRPSVDLEEPDLRIVAYVRGRGCSLGIDLSGTSLHRRGWRGEQGGAPLKETLAAGMLIRGQWAERAARGEPLLDPVCGAGTLLIEAACIAMDRAPALARGRFGFTQWKGHDVAAWTELLAEAKERARVGESGVVPTILGYDADETAIARARANAAAAGVAKAVQVSRASIRDVQPPQGPGLFVANPPYGARMGTEAQVRMVFDELATLMHGPCAGWHAELIVAEATPLALLGLPHAEAAAVDNGPIPCRLLSGETGRPSAGEGDAAPAAAIDDAPFAGRLRKNLARLGTWARNFGVSCYRIYDDEIPSFRAIVDRYGDAVHLQEYQAPRNVDPQVAEARLTAMIDATARELGVDRRKIYVKRRRPQTRGTQYGQFDARGEEFAVREGEATFLVNLTDYLDTGLFLDHRALRRLLVQLVTERGGAPRLLNLFSYTGSFSVVAARAGARTTSIDLSNTYLAWAERNFAANGLDVRRHAFVRADCTRWLSESEQRWDLIVLDPPSYSASKSMSSNFEIQRDHVALVKQCLQRLAPGGTLLFSTNKRGFVLDAEALPELRDITATTLDPDVRRSPPPHLCWRADRV
jgi:23S rRNA (guanine2445-N2)-methyltransferase / 23S rRNA (guanine2069-N7)-methyltransferase